MIGLGFFNTLTVSHQTPQGWYLADEEGTEVLLPNAEIPAQISEGITLEVFCYLDHLERPTLSLKKPLVQRNQFAFLKIAHRSSDGYFLEWGLQKQLFLPFRESADDLKVGAYVLIYCYLDELSGRLVASKRWKKYIQPAQESIATGTSFSGILASTSDLGFEFILDHCFLGLLYHGPDTEQLRLGDQRTVYVIRQREDLKIDLSLRPIGIQAIEEGAAYLLDALKQANQGFIALTDHSSPDQISMQLGMSKKLFKKAVGGLLKAGYVQLEKDGVRLITTP